MGGYTPSNQDDTDCRHYRHGLVRHWSGSIAWLQLCWKLNTQFLKKKSWCEIIRCCVLTEVCVGMNTIYHNAGLSVDNGAVARWNRHGRCQGWMYIAQRLFLIRSNGSIVIVQPQRGFILMVWNKHNMASLDYTFVRDSLVPCCDCVVAGVLRYSKIHEWNSPNTVFLHLIFSDKACVCTVW